ncbi:universal stress protein [Natrialbaceae archaeon A-CW2]|uniref:universal stress protein n=1 Tax=Natronosalvus amylolyticus TaxID=2961994 RepID=UPI0020C99C11|nr:universal stress protein [Natronosalvus amylolyticus]
MHVLLGLEGSDESLKTLEKTLERVQEVGDELTVAVVGKPEAKRSVEEMRDLTQDHLETEGVDADIEILDGDPGSALVEYAEAEGFDQLVIGGGTRSPMGKVRLGPITEFVLLNATVTVKLVR